MDAAAIPVSIHPARDEGAEVASVCCYCGTGCGVRVRVSQGAVLAVRGDDSHPPTTAGCAARAWPWPTRSAPIMRACSPRPGARARTSRASRSGWTRRWTSPPTGWPTPSSGTGRILLFYLSGQLLTEDYAVFNKLARALVGTNNIDTNSRLCMSSAVSGYKRTLGADAPPACYEDLELADTVLIAGSNMAYAHPVLFRRLEAARARRPGMKLIVVDPRRTDTASGADLHLPLTPGSDVALFHAMLNVMVWEGLVDQDYISAHTSGFEALKARIHEFTPGAAAEVCGIPARDIIQAARWFGGADAALSLYTMGLNQSASGTDKNTALIHLHLATGQIGRPGAGRSR